jgi:enoyl-CoA hydratase/carnithine racemase
MPLGFVSEGGSSYTFPKVIGRQRANALLLAGDRLSAQEMYVSGFVTAVVPAESTDAFLVTGCEKAKKIACYNGESLRMAKALTRVAEGTEEQKAASRREGRDLVVRLNSEDAKENMRAFAEKARASQLWNGI